MEASSQATVRARQLDEPDTLPRETQRPSIEVGDVIRTDPAPPPPVMLMRSDLTLGSAPIPASRYHSREFHEREHDRLWPKVWQFACWGQDIPNPGDIHVYRILDQSVLIVRQRDGSLRAFRNACLHRGRELCEHSGHRAELKCPYHFFTWSLAGDIKWVPSQWDFPQIDEAQFRLPEVRLESWNGFVFVNFDDSAAPLETYLGAMVEHWQGWSFDNRFKACHVQKRIRCNWKTGLDAFIEGFHTFASHPQFASIVPDDCSQQDIFAGEPHFSRFHFLAGLPSPRLDPRPTEQDVFEALCADFMPEAIGTEDGRLKPGETARAATARIARMAYERNFGIDASSLSTAELIDAVSYYVFPNLLPWPTLSFPLVYRFLPDEDPDWCMWDTMLMLPFTGERPPSAQIVQLGPDDSFEDVAALGKLALILEQDAEQLPAVQRGMRNLRSGAITLSEYQELRIRHYHRILETYLDIQSTDS